MPGVGECGLNGTREPSTVSARQIVERGQDVARLGMMAVLELVVFLRDGSGQQSRGVTIVAIIAP